MQFIKKSLLAIFGGLIKPALVKIIQEEGDKLQQRVKDAVANEGPQAIDKVFDNFQKTIIEKINSI